MVTIRALLRATQLLLEDSTSLKLILMMLEMVLICYILLFAGYNGISGGANGDDRGNRRRNYKLIADPMLKSGPQKIYRFDGHNPGVRASDVASTAIPLREAFQVYLAHG